MIGMDLWETFPFRMVINRSLDNNEYGRFSELLKQHDLNWMLMGTLVGFRTEEELNIAKLLY